MWKKLGMAGLLLLLPFLTLGGGHEHVPQDTVAVGGADAGMMDYCRSGGDGVGWNGTDECYTATCGNYNWSGLATWITCDGEADPDGACLYEGERVKATGVLQDIMLAAQATCHGGSIYLPRGIYPWRGCGAGAPDTCPTSEDGSNRIRHIDMYGGRRLVGEGVDTDGPEMNGRVGTWLLDDGGRDSSTGSGGEDGDGVVISDWNFRTGLYAATRICVPAATPYNGVCDPDDASVEDTQSETVSLWGESSTITDDTVYPRDHTSQWVRLCVDDGLANTGMCSGDHRVRCTVDGDCTGHDAGWTCKGFVETIEDELAAGEKIYLAMKLGNITWDLSTGFGMDNSVVVPVISADHSAFTNCTGDGRNVAIGLDRSGSGLLQWPFATPFVDVSVSAKEVVRVVDLDKWDQGGGYSYEHINFMPQNWYGRDSSDNTEDCTVGTEAACDSGEMFGLMGGYKGGLNDVTIWYPSVEGFSAIDGDISGVQTKVHNSLIAGGKRGLLTDASNWDFYNNIWQDNLTASTDCLLSIYTNQSTFRDQTFIDNMSRCAIRFSEGSKGSLVSNIKFFGGNYFYYAAFLVQEGQFHTIQHVSGQSVTGRLLVISPDDDDTVAHFTMKDVHLYGTPNRPPKTNYGVPMYAWGGILITDELEGDDGAGELDDINIEDVHLQMGGDSCFMWFDAGGDDAAGSTVSDTLAANASGGDSSITLADDTGFTANDGIVIILDDGTALKAEVTDLPGGNVLTLESALPGSGVIAAIGNTVLWGPDLGMEYDMEKVTIKNSSMDTVDANICTAAGVPFDCCTGAGAGANCGGKFICFSDDDDTANPKSQHAQDLVWEYNDDPTARLPRLENNSLNGVKQPDFNYSLVACSQTPDSDDLPAGFSVGVYNDDGSCTDTNGVLDGGGTTINSCCTNGSGDWVVCY